MTKGPSSPRKPEVLMVGIGISTTTGIATVVKNWLATDFPDKVNLRYLSTQRESVPGAYLAKFVDGSFALLKIAVLFFGRLLPPLDQKAIVTSAPRG